MNSMQDIAKLVGVSKATVSLVLSGKSGKRVSAATREKILTAARENNFRINDIARSLRTGKSKIISVIVTDISNYFFGKLTFHIQEEAKKYGYLILIANNNENDADFDEIVSTLLSKKVDGIIAVPTAHSSETIKRIIDSNIPVVQVDRFVEDLELPYVGVNNYDSARQALDDLISTGCRKTALLSPGLNVSPVTERYNAYIDAVKAAGIYDESVIWRIDFGSREEHCALAAKKILESGVDSVFFSSRRLFNHGVKAIHDLDPTALSRIKFLSFDEVSSYFSQEQNLWYIEHPIEQLARKSFGLLLDWIHGKKDVGHYILETTCVKP